MKKQLRYLSLCALLFTACEKNVYSPEDEAYSATYSLARVEKSSPQVYTNAGLVNYSATNITHTPPFTDDTLTTIRKITFFKKTFSEIKRVNADEGKSYYSVKNLDHAVEFSPKFYGIYYKFNPSSNAVFEPSKEEAEIKAGLTIKAQETKEGMVITKYVMAFKNKERLVGKVDENYLDPTNYTKLKAGDTLVTMQYRVYLKKN